MLLYKVRLLTNLVTSLPKNGCSVNPRGNGFKEPLWLQPQAPLLKDWDQTERGRSFQPA